LRTHVVFIWEFTMKSIVIGRRLSSPCRSLNVAASAVLLASTGAAHAIAAAPSPPTQAQAASSEADLSAVDSRITDLTKEVEDLKRLVHELQEQLPKPTQTQAVVVPDATPLRSASAQSGGLVKKKAHGETERSRGGFRELRLR